jgi:cell division protein FtsB
MVKELERKQKLRQLLYSWPSIGLLAVITFFLAKGAFQLVEIERDSAHKVSNLEAQAAKLELREKELQEDINKLRTEEGIIEEIKSKFSATREGEYVAIVVDEKPAAASTTDDISWYKKLWNAIISEQ